MTIGQNGFFYLNKVTGDTKVAREMQAQAHEGYVEGGQFYPKHPFV